MSAYTIGRIYGLYVSYPNADYKNDVLQCIVCILAWTRIKMLECYFFFLKLCICTIAPGKF